MTQKLSILAILCAAACAVEPMPLAEYHSIDRGTMMLVEGDRGYLGENPRAPDPIGDGVEFYGLLQPLKHHPLKGGSCVAFEHIAFARREQMKEADTFVCGGVAFRVARCTAPEAKCSSFEMEAYCEDFREGRCNSRGVPANGQPTYTYGYEAEKGLAWVDFAPGESTSTARLTLYGSRGMVL